MMYLQKHQPPLGG